MSGCEWAYSGTCVAGVRRGPLRHSGVNAISNELSVWVFRLRHISYSIFEQAAVQHKDVAVSTGMFSERGLTRLPAGASVDVIPGLPFMSVFLSTVVTEAAVSNMSARFLRMLITQVVQPLTVHCPATMRHVVLPLLLQATVGPTLGFVEYVAMRRMPYMSPCPCYP